ncbi:MAG: hypothetical protein MUC88_25030 [Planctomycetes bacterium]|jgi:hypothetical protein|nr:hypothetical protein [Planctomycetota bacterium]
MIVNASERQAAAVWVVLLAAIPAARAQQIAPNLGYVYPAGGRQDATFQIQIGGRSLDSVSAVYVSGAGVRATMLAYDKPLSQKEINTMREKLLELQKQRGKNATTMQEMAQMRDRIADSMRRNANPALAETVTVEVAIAPDAAPGQRQLRLRTPLGLSNPLVFCVAQLPEFCESGAETIVTLPAVVNGRLVPGEGNRNAYFSRQAQQYQAADVDRYRFQARRGQHLIVAASARELIPYLADAVPGWFQAVVSLYDVRGRELAYDDDYRFHPDPVLHYEIPTDGDYFVEIRDAIYRGREDFVYRIAMGELPFVTSIFPLGGPAGAKTMVEIKGWNLPADPLTMDATDQAPGLHPLSVRAGQQVSNTVPFAVDTIRECLEQAPNNSPDNAQAVTLPVIVNGRIDQAGAWDVFRFEGRAGDKIVAEVCARRLDSPLDSVLKLTDAAGRQLAFNDDYEDKGSGLDTHHADSFLMATLPADGTYRLHLGDAQGKGGVEYAYRLRLSPPRPDFELRLCPSAINGGAGQTIPVTVYALRQDGFSGDITLTLKDVPPGFLLSGGVVPGGQNRVPVTLTLPPLPQDEPISLSLEGRATIQGQEIVRRAVPADDMMQAFAYRHLVPARDLQVVLTRRGATRSFARILSEPPIRIPAGGTAPVRVGLPAVKFFDKIEFELSEPPEGITVQGTSSGPRGTVLTLQADAAKARPGLKGNLIVTIFGERTPASGPGKPKTNRQRSPLGTLPAIPFEIVAR